MALDIASAIDITDATRSFVLVPDTNSLWTRTIASLRLCSSQFETSWHELCKPADIRLCIPAIVFNERCYQVVNSLWSDYTKAAASLERIGLTLNRDMAAPGFTWDELRECVCARLEEQVRALPQAAVIETPFEAIGANQLREIAEASVWRRAPFKAGDKEQGFRDALILETVKAAVCRNPHSDVHFLCSDRRLAEAAETQLRGSRTLACSRISSSSTASLH